MYGPNCQVLPLVVQWALITFDFQQGIAIYLLIVGFAVAFFLAFAVGANDAANSWATSVGAGTVSLGWAYALGSLMETLGATFVSGYVIQNLVEGIINIELYRSGENETVAEWEDWHSKEGSQSNSTLLLDKEKMLMVGALSTLLSSAFLQMSAIYLSLPVSGSHSIVSGLLGFTLVAHGNSGVNWPKTIAVLLGWIFSPVISMFLTAIFYLPLYTLVVKASNPYSGTSKIVYSFVFGLTISINSATILTTGEFFYNTTGLSDEWNGGRGFFFLVSFWVGLCVSVLVYLAIIPCIINAEGDFALRCDCCNSGSSMGRKISTMRNISQQGAPSAPVASSDDVHWLHQQRVNKAFADENVTRIREINTVETVPLPALPDDMDDVEEVIKLPNIMNGQRTNLDISEDYEDSPRKRLTPRKLKSSILPVEALDNVVVSTQKDIAKLVTVSIIIASCRVARIIFLQTL